MAVPRHKLSKSKKRQRRSHHALKAGSLTVHPRSQQLVPSHRVCPFTGFYRGKKRLDVEGL